MRKAVSWLALAAAALAGAGLLAFALTASGGHTSTAGRARASSCAQRLLRDWSDGRIDGTYPVACYRAALRSMPADLKIYSSAPEDLAAALRHRIVAGARRPAG